MVKKKELNVEVEQLQENLLAEVRSHDNLVENVRAFFKLEVAYLIVLALYFVGVYTSQLVLLSVAGLASILYLANRYYLMYKIGWK